MSIYNSDRRFVMAVMVGAGLCGIYLMFRAVTSPFLDVERKKHDFKPTEPPTQPEFRRDAGKWFPASKWVENAQKHFFDDGRYLFCNKFDLVDDGRSVNVRPIAMLWRDETNDVPLTIVADQAQLNASTRFLNEDTDFGRITSGYISGHVRIDGERGLRITGDTFTLSEESMTLWSGTPVQFEWDGHTGYAKGGVEIHLHAATEGRAGLGGVAEINKVKLLGEVICNVAIRGSHQNEPDLKMQIRAPGGFGFDVATKTATFLGLRQRNTSSRLSVKQDVWVQRTTPGGMKDHLICPELELQFRETVDTADNESLGPSLEPEHVMAWGRRVVFYSQENQLRLEATQAQYFLDERRIEISSPRSGTDGEAGLVTVRRPGSKISVSRIQIMHTVDGSVQRLECRGAGSIEGSGEAIAAVDSDSESYDRSFSASWLESLVLQLAPDGVTRILKLTGDASVFEESQDFGLSADSIALRLAGGRGTGPKGRLRDPVMPQSVTRIPSAVSQSDSRKSAEFDFSELRPELLTASGNIRLQSPEGSGHLRERLRVRFESVMPTNIVQTASQESSSSAGNAKSNPNSTSPDSVSFVSDSLEAVIKIGAKRQMQFHDVWLKGGVEVSRQSEKKSNEFTASGNQLYASNGLLNDREIQLFGDPARVRSSTGELQGPRIDFKELSGKANVVGSGRIQFVTNKGLDGSKLATPTPIDIYWSDHMKFGARSADFVGNIRVFMSDEATQKVEVRCAGLTVHFSDDVSLGPRGADGGFATIGSATNDGKSQEGMIERIECHSKVTVNVDQTIDGVPNGRHRAHFADLHVNLQTGDFNATGPGQLESVSPDKDGQLQGSSPVTVRANSPAQTTETAFIFMQTEFVGEMNGNLHRKEVQLSQNVVALVTPARHVEEKVNLREVPTEQLPERAGILQAEHLSISSIKMPDTESASFAMVARENARLESRSIAARADVITYDHAKQQFIIRADGDGRVTVNHRSRQGGKFNSFSGNRFEYYRRTDQLKGNRIGGLDVTD